MSNRSFVSIDLDGLGDEIAAVQDSFVDASGLNFTDPEQAHVTLARVEHAGGKELVRERDPTVGSTRFG